MKRILSMFTVVTLTVGLLGSCAKINERLDSLEEKVDGIENEEIATIESQIASINSSISDLESIRQKVQGMSDPATGLSKRIEDLKTFVNDELSHYATKDWAKTTLVTMEEYEKTCDTVAKIALRVEGFDSSLKACAESLKGWVNGKFGGYYDIATIDAKLAELWAQVDGVDSLRAELAKTREEIDTAKSAIRAEYRAAITSAIETSEGKLTQALQDAIDGVNATIDTLTGRVGILETKVEALKGRVDSLENMIQTVTIVPAFSDGSVEVENDTLSIDCIISPAEVVKALDPADFTILLNKVRTKAVSLDTVPTNRIKAFTKDTLNGTVSIKAHITRILDELEDDYSLSVAANVSNGISNYTTEFVKVTISASVRLDRHSIVVPSPESDEDTTLFAIVRGANKSVEWETTGYCTEVNDGHITIKANVVGKDTIVVKTVEGDATDTCFVIVGAISSEFTVNAQGKKIHFSQGNLYYDGTKFDIEAKQYDFHGYDSGSNSYGLFGWVGASSAQFTSFPEIYGVSNITIKSAYGNALGEALKADWGKAIGDGNTWCTLTKAEWMYLCNGNRMINRKPCYSNKVSGISIGGILYHGVFIYPDNYAGEEVSGSMTWDDINSAGIVFLPAAGFRNGTSVGYVGGYGFYWSSSASTDTENSAVAMYFQDRVYVEPDYTFDRYFGFSVRLVTECL